MKKILYTTTAFVLCGGIVQANAACIATPSCTTLGYTSTTSCTDGLKCPFGNYWNCTHINKITELTNKITELEKVIETSQSQGEICAIGSTLYSDKSCSIIPQKGKTPIGIVVYVDGKGGGQAMALKSMEHYQWGTRNGEVAGLQNYLTTSDASQDYASCKNSKTIMAAGDKNKYPAAWVANEYKTEGTSAGDWCLPAAGIFTSYYNNQEAIKTAFSRVNGIPFTSDTKAWSSTVYSNSYAWYSNFSEKYKFGLNHSYEYDYLYYGEVRPVIEF